MEPNQEVFNREALDPTCEGKPSVGLVDGLLPPERYLFERYEDELRAARLIDLGIGGGRTSTYLLGRCRSYVGLDYAPNMIALCRRRYPQPSADTFVVGDARDLSRFHEASFDAGTFSYNGLDYIEHSGRLQVLSELKRVIRPQGLFIFSAHSLHVYPFPDLDGHVRTHDVDESEIEQRGYRLVRDYAQTVVTYYIYPATQVRQLDQAGFEVLDLVDQAGQLYDPANPSTDWMVYYACRRR